MVRSLAFEMEGGMSLLTREWSKPTVRLPVNATPREEQELRREGARIRGIVRRRMYVDGSQYDVENEDQATALGIDRTRQTMPEHLRKHAYSTQIEEAVGFLADQLAQEFAIEAEVPEVQETLMAFLQASDQLSGDDDSSFVSVENPLREALIAGDVAGELKWDPVAETVYLDLWESERVQFEYEDRRTLLKVTRRETVWELDDADEWVEVEERRVYELWPNEAGELECRVDTYWDDDEGPRFQEWLGIPMIPWCLLRGNARSLRAVRGESVITDQVMEHADRLNAVEHQSYRIARYNAHSNVVVTGDATLLEARAGGHTEKDVADVLTFPGGTAVQALTLPTDPQMIEHQRRVLIDAIFGSFGVQRVDHETLPGYGGLSGYALEILNRKTNATFARVRRTFLRDLRSMFDLVLDLTAYWRSTSEVDEPVMDDELPLVRFETVLPETVFPNRSLSVRLGTGYVVDDVMIRQDFAVGMISRKEALRMRGISEKEVDRIAQEVLDEKVEEERMLLGEAGAPVGRTVMAGSTLSNLEGG